MGSADEVVPEKPGDGAEVVWLKFVVSELSGGGVYDIQISGDSGFSGTLVYEKADSDSNILSITDGEACNITSGNIYYWRVRAHKTGGDWGKWSSALSFTASNSVSATNISPEDGGTTLDTTPLLDWDDVTDAVGYDVQISSDSGFSTIVEENATLTASQYQLQATLAVGNYYWRVRIKNADGVLGSWSSVWSFNVLVLSIGDNYAGGIVFYLDGTGQHGLVAAESDQSTGVEWSGYGIYIGGTSTAVGTGSSNTTAIVAALGNNGGTAYAAKICADLVLNGYDDWFFPSKDELNLMYRNLKMAGLGGFADANYWASSESDYYHAWSQSFGGYGQGSYNEKPANYHVRAARAF